MSNVGPSDSRAAGVAVIITNANKGKENIKIILLMICRTLIVILYHLYH